MKTGLLEHIELQLPKGFTVREAVLSDITNARECAFIPPSTASKRKSDPAGKSVYNRFDE